MAITKQDVWRVANEINAGGEKPSAVEVRKRLGTGSYTTITAALKEWVEPEASDGDELAPVPAEFEDRIVQAGAHLFAIAMRIAGEQFQAERDAWAAERAQIEAERDEAIRLADAVTADLDEAREQIGQLRTEASQLVSERAQAHAVAEERGRTAQVAQAEAHKAKEAAGEMLGQIRSLQDRIHEQITQLTEANARELRVIAQLDEARRNIENLQVERDGALATAEERAQTAQAARIEAETARSMVERLNGRVEALEAVIANLQPATAPEKPAAKKAKAGNGDKSSTRTDPSVTNPEG